jgi:hypothetical protein
MKKQWMAIHYHWIKWIMMYDVWFKIKNELIIKNNDIYYFLFIIYSKDSYIIILKQIC